MAWRSQLSKNLKELRILFCQTSPASSHTRFQYLTFLTLHFAPQYVFLNSNAFPKLSLIMHVDFREFVEKNYKALEDFAKAGAALKT
ncbi:hypothetical protein Droror1_Dr00007996 [Drosera rotundifolia]